MVTIKNGKQKWVITEKQYEDEKALWNSRGKVECDYKDPILKGQEIVKLKVDPEVLSENDSTIFDKEIKNPKQPNEALKKAKKTKQ